MNNGSQPAFPCNEIEDGETIQHPGMTIRQWYAGQAIVGMVAAGISYSPEAVANEAFAIADAMIKKDRGY